MVHSKQPKHPENKKFMVSKLEYRKIENWLIYYQSKDPELFAGHYIAI